MRGWSTVCGLGFPDPLAWYPQLKIPVKNWTWIRGQSGLKLDMGGGWGISSLCALD